jgi:hypothetical protein
MTRAITFMVVVSAVLAGCTSSGVLELEILLPQVPAGTPAFVRVQARKDVEFTAEWLGTGDLEPIALSDAERVRDHVSIVSDDELIDLRIKLTYCETSSCSDVESMVYGEGWYELKRPFYLGKQTRYFLDAGTMMPSGEPAMPVMVDRCDIEGCVEGELSSFCRADGRHLCE